MIDATLSKLNHLYTDLAIHANPYVLADYTFIFMEKHKKEKTSA